MLNGIWGNRIIRKQAIDLDKKDFYSTKGDAYKAVCKDIENWPQWKKDALNQNLRKATHI